MRRGTRRRAPALIHPTAWLLVAIALTSLGALPARADRTGLDAVRAARAAEEAAKAEFERAMERLATDPANAPAKRVNKVRQDRRNEALDARKAWDEATRRLHEAEDALEASREQERSTSEGRRLAANTDDGFRALATADAAVARCDAVEFDLARRRAARAIQRLAQLADRWLVASAGSAQREWGEAALDAMSELATRWSAIEAQWFARCAGRAEPLDGLASGPPSAATPNGDDAGDEPVAADAPLAADVACPGLGGADQLTWLATLDARAKERFGATKAETTALRTPLGENERVVLYTLHRSRLYDLAGQIAAWNDLLRGSGEAVPGSVVDAASQRALPSFVEDYLANGGEGAETGARGRATTPEFQRARDAFVETLSEQADAYAERVAARDAALGAFEQAHAAVEDALTEPQEPFRTNERRSREQSDPAFAEQVADEARARQALEDANASVLAADRAIGRNPVLGSEGEGGRRLVEVLADSGVADATKQEYVDNAIRRHIESLWAEFERIAGLTSFEQLADELLHPLFAPLHDYTARVLSQFCFKRAPVVMGQLQKVYLSNATKEMLDEKGEGLVFAGIGLGLFALTSLGATVLTAGGASPLLVSTFLATVGSADVAFAVAEFTRTDARVEQAEKEFALRLQSASAGALTQQEALDADSARLQAQRVNRLVQGGAVVLTIGGAVIDLTEASIRAYRAVGGLDETVDAVADAGRLSSGGSSFAMRGPFPNAGALRTANIIESFPASARPRVVDIGPLPRAVERTALPTISKYAGELNKMLAGKPVTDTVAQELNEAIRILLDAELVIDGAVTKLVRPLGAGSYGVVFATADGRALRFASSSGGIKRAFQAAEDGLAGAAALANAMIPGVGFPQIFVVGTQGGRARVFVSELIPRSALGQSPEELVDTLAGLTDAGLVYYDAAGRNLYRGGILDPDLLGVPTIDEASRLGYRLGYHALAVSPQDFNDFTAVLTPFDRTVREAALLDPRVVNLAMLGHEGVFELGIKTVGGKKAFVLEPGTVSLEYLTEHFPYFGEFRRAVEALAPGELLQAVPGGAFVKGGVASATSVAAKAPVPGVIHLVPTIPVPATGGAGSAVRAMAQLVGTGLGPYGFLTTLAPLEWTKVASPVPVPQQAGGGVLVPVTTSELEKLARLLVDADGVAAVEADKRLRPEIALPDDPYFRSRGSWGQAHEDQWALRRVVFGDAGESVAAFAAAAGAREPAIVAVLDSGLDRSHPDLAPSSLWRNEREQPNGRDDDGNGYVDDVAGWDFVDDDAEPEDALGHGTHVAGIIAAATGNGAGIAGVNPRARILPLRILDAVGRGRASRLAAAVFYAVDRGARVINLSLGGEGLSYTERLAVDYATRAGVLVVVAAGNVAADTSSYGPAGLGSALAVVATGPDDERAGFSNFGDAVAIAAPGVDVLSLRARDTDFAAVVAVEDARSSGGPVDDAGLYYRASGTSFAAPFVSGVASLLVGARPALTRAEIVRALSMSARDLGVPGYDRLTGFGLLDAPKALTADPAWFLLARVDRIEIAAGVDGQARIDVVGTVEGSALVDYALELGRGESPSAWREVGRARAPVSSGLLGRVPLDAITEAGRFTVRVVARDEGGRTREARGALEVE